MIGSQRSLGDLQTQFPISGSSAKERVDMSPYRSVKHYVTCLGPASKKNSVTDFQKVDIFSWHQEFHKKICKTFFPSTNMWAWVFFLAVKEFPPSPFPLLYILSSQVDCSFADLVGTRCKRGKLSVTRHHKCWETFGVVGKPHLNASRNLHKLWKTRVFWQSATCSMIFHNFIWVLITNC